MNSFVKFTIRYNQFPFFPFLSFCLQISSAVLRNERPDIPPLNQLPGFGKGINEAQEISVSKYIELMKRCWAQDPLQRPNFSVVAAELEELLREEGVTFLKKIISI